MKNFIFCFNIFLLLFLPTTNYAAVLVKAQMWPKNTHLNVVFIDGSVKQKVQVKKYASLWIQDSSLHFKFFDGFSNAPKQTHIRISFSSHTGSQAGNHGDYLSVKPTLLLNQLNESDLLPDNIRQIILHEFGHALGFEHEYRNPKWPYGNGAIKQQVANCIPRMQKLKYNLIDAEDRCRQINQPLNQKVIFSTVYDERSIMNYTHRIVMPDNSVKTIKPKTQLSILDKLAMQRWYAK